MSRIITASCVRSGTLSNNTPPVRNTLRHRRNTTVTDSEGGGEWGVCAGGGAARGGIEDAPVLSKGVGALVGLLKTVHRKALYGMVLSGISDQ